MVYDEATTEYTAERAVLEFVHRAAGAPNEPRVDTCPCKARSSMTVREELRLARAALERVALAHRLRARVVDEIPEAIGDLGEDETAAANVDAMLKSDVGQAFQNVAAGSTRRLGSSTSSPHARARAKRSRPA